MKYESNFRKTVKKFFRRKLAVVGLVICLVMLFVAIMGPLSVLLLSVRNGSRGPLPATFLRTSVRY